MLEKATHGQTVFANCSLRQIRMFHQTNNRDREREKERERERERERKRKREKEREREREIRLL